jgi:alpha-beta hydrolase superfamily lysophospholipase
MTDPTTAELRAIGELAADAFGAAAGRIEEMHANIAARAFGASGEGALPAQRTHDAIAGTVYAAVRQGGGILARAAANAFAVTGSPRRAPSVTPRGRAAIGAINGAFGDALERAGSPLAIEMAVRVDGEDIPATPDGLAGAFPAAADDVVVFLHGLCETESAWRLARLGCEPYAERLSRELGMTAVELRYNSGLRISDNGQRLSELMAALVEAWPVRMRRLVLVGHSMGGLIIRAACHHATLDRSRWTARLGDCVYLGAPHDGAALERSANSVAWALNALPETRALAGALRWRSVGIKDLRHGVICEDDWRDRDPDARDRFERTPIPLLGGVRHHAVAATLGEKSRGASARVLGDLLVPFSSATGAGRRPLGFERARVRHIPNCDHIALLCHPGVSDQLVDWLREPKALPPAEPSLWRRMSRR